MASDAIHRAVRRGRGGLLLALVGLAGCSVAFDPDRSQCEVDDDCREELTGTAGLSCVSGLCSGGAGPWACAGPLEFPDPPIPVTVTRAFIDLISGEPLRVEVTVCSGVDTSCSSPLLPTIESDANGLVTFQVMSGAEGFMQVISENHLPGIALFGPGHRDEVDPLPQPLITAEAYAGLAAAAGATPDLANAGHLFIGTHPCPGGSRAGVRYEVDRRLPSTARYYLQAGAPSLSLMQTDESGRGGFVNLPEGFVTLIATDVASDEELGLIPFLSRRGWITSVGFTPDDVSL